MKKKYADIRLATQERKAINAFSRRLRKKLGKQLVSVMLFGSKVRGDSRRDSDIDIFILIKNKRNNANDRIAEVTAGVLEDFGVLLSPVSYDLHEAEMNAKMHSFFFEEVTKEGVAV